jgi:pyruvate dehydrogenase E2 component (dihydrolipoamide acetyltransferase)
MAEEFFIPKLGQTVEEVTLVKWLVQDGDKVSQGQPVMEVETDKAIFPVEANARGYIHIGPYQEGEVLPVLTVVAVIGTPEEKFVKQGEAISAPGAPPPEEEHREPREAPIAEPGGAGNGSRLFASPRARKLAAEKEVDLSQVKPTGFGGIRVAERDVQAYLSQLPRITPVAQRLAAQAGVDLRTISGSGPGGRITRTDVERSLQQAPATPAPMPPAAQPPLQAGPFADLEVLERVPLSGVRGVIASRMATSAHTTARVTLVMEVDATQLVAMRTRLKAKVEQEWGFAPGYNDLLGKILALALRKFPYMNARLTEDAIELLKPVNLGMAVDTPRGLLVPVIRDADQKDLRQFGLEFRALVERAQKRKSLPEDLSNGTFTLTSLGAFGVDAFTPVINYPEAAILGVGRIAPKAVPQGDQVVVRTMCTLSLVFDHRLVDGAPAARFLAYIKELVEEPYLWLATL